MVSRVEEKSFVTADQDVNTAILSLNRDPTAAEPTGTVDEQKGVEAILHAPSNTTLANQDTAGFSMTHPDTVLMPDGSTIGPIAFIDQTRVVGGGANGTAVAVTNELPSSKGEYTFQAGSGDLMGVRNQANTTSALRLINAPMVTVQHLGGSKLSGRTSSSATALTPSGSREVRATTHAEFGKLSILPTQFAAGGIVIIQNFVGDETCVSTGTLATGVTTGSWSATLNYYQDLTADSNDNGTYTTLALSGGVGVAGADPLAALDPSRGGTNKKVLNNGGAGDDPSDLWLFDNPSASQNGYLKTFTTLKTMGATKTATESTVTMGQAITIGTVRTDAGNAQSELTINAAQMSCEAVDKRG
jgi:hypothetical protein